ncbi:hypothetical protein ACFLYU_03510 [Candidatus Dependentiae bacterium]
MKIKCISDKGCGGFIEKGNIYNVYAILMYKGGLSFLVSENSEYPMDHPIELFEILSNYLPPIWYFKFIDSKESKMRKDLLTAIWGYKEIVFDQDHYYNLLERESEPTNIFARRKEEIDEYEELLKNN